MYAIEKNLTNVNYTPRGTNPSWIVIHNTANGTSAAGTAYNNTAYFKNAYRRASAHYFVDDSDTVWQCVEDTDTAWHVGDRYPSYNGASNYNAIGIEVCETANGSFTAHEIDVLSWLVPMLMERYGIDASHVCRHYDVTGKACPWGYIDSAAWAQLKDEITNGGDFMAGIDELLNHKLATADSGEVPIWQLWSWGYTWALRGYNKAAELEKKVSELEKKVAEIQVGGVDVQAVAKAVNDDAAERLKA